MKTSFLHNRIGLLTASAFALALAACGGGGGGGSSTGTSPAPAPAPVPAPAPDPAPAPNPTPGIPIGFMSVALASEKACGFDAVNVTVTKVRFNMSATAAATDGGWTDITLSPALRINLAEMNNGAVQALGIRGLAPGHYAQTRLVLDQNASSDTTNSVVLTGTTTEVPLVTQAAAPEGIAIGSGFDIADGQNLSMVAGFDACRSVVTKNRTEFYLRPIVKSLPPVKNGIEGYVATSLLGSHVRVTAQQSGVVARSTSPDPVTGKFELSRLAPGSYNIVVTADGNAASVVTSVPVDSATSITALNSAATPITMQAGVGGSISLLMGLSPYSTVQSPLGSAVQHLTTGETLVIGYRLADLGNGEIAFNKLPTVAPQVATFSAGSALTFAAQPTVTPAPGSYELVASADGYLTVLVLTKQAVP